MRYLLIGTLVVLGTRARADTRAGADDRATPPTAADVADAPPPQQAHGRSVQRVESASAGRVLARALLFVPRWTAEVAFAPVRGALWTYDRFQLGERARQIFFNDDGTAGVFPVALFETGFGLNIGGRLIYRELLGDGKLSARASYGGQYRQLYTLKANTGTWLGGDFVLDAGVQYEVFAKSRFFGFGNADVADMAPAMAVDPLTHDAATASRFRHDDLTVESSLHGRLIGDWWLAFSTIYTRRVFGDDVEPGTGQPNIIDVYDTGRLVGWRTGLQTLYTELELTFDSRRTTSDYLSRAVQATGWKVRGFGGLVQALEGPTDYWRYGADVQRYVNLHRGARFVVVRAYLESVTGDIDEVGFVDLPRLGGPIYLRGYERDRFRDRIATLAAVEYNYPAGGNLSGFVFVDAGRVFRGYRDAAVEGMRVGFGGGIQGHTRNTFLTRAFVSSSIDGDVFLNVSFDPTYDTRSREESL